MNRVTADSPARPATIGAVMREARLLCGFSRRHTAARAGLHVNTIGLIERDATDPAVSVVAQIAASLNVPMSVLFTVIEKRKEKV